MLFVAAVLATSSPCSADAIAAAAIVSPVHVGAMGAVGLSNVADGFQRPSVQDIKWETRCTPTIVGVYGGATLVAADGLMLWSRGQPRLEIRDGQMLPADPEPAHIQWNGHRFAGSAKLLIGAWRVGAWVRPDGTTDIARYRPGDPTSPVILMTSAQPILGLFYLAAPDASGGTLFFAQRLGQSQFRMISVPWSEVGLRKTKQ